MGNLFRVAREAGLPLPLVNVVLDSGFDPHHVYTLLGTDHALAGAT